MKLRTYPLIALSLLLSACSSIQSYQSSRRPVPPPVRGENKVTAWGELPSYQQEGQYFRLFVEPRAYERVLFGRAVVDVLVNADGVVQDAAIFESSGDADYDAYALKLYKNSRYSLRLDAGDPAPFVVRQEFATRPQGESHRGYIDTTNYRTMGPDVRPTPGPYGNVSSSSTSSN